MLKELILFLVGIFVGGMNAIAGGGMLVGFPVLLAMGIPALFANATSGVIVLPGQLASAYGYRAFLKKVPKQYLILLVPCAVGAGIGATILRYTTAASFEKIVPGLILFSVILFAFQPLLHFHLHRHVTTVMRNKKVSYWPPVWIVFAILPLAVYGGYFGAGFGFVILAFLGFTSLRDAHMMNALKNMAASTMAVVSIICLLGAHLIDWKHGLIMAAGTTIGGFYGARAVQKVSTHTIRFVVIAIGLTTATYLCFRTY